MTHYGYDPDRRVVVATWPAGVGNAATLTATVPSGISEGVGQNLAAALERLSSSMWRTYTHPGVDIPWIDIASVDVTDIDVPGPPGSGEDAATGGDPAHGSDPWDLGLPDLGGGPAAGEDVPTRSIWVSADGSESSDDTGGADAEALAAVVPALREPHLPDESGLVLVSYDPLVEYAHHLGRLLHQCADADLLEAVAADVAAELDAVERAHLGDLQGRAQQAVALSRADASPLQIRAAHAMLQREPLGSDELFVGIDPTAASVAAAHWLRAAAGVAAERSGRDPIGVVEEADDIEALPVLTPTLALARMIEEGASPRTVVTDLVREALEAAEGRIPDLDALVTQIGVADARAQQVGDDRRDEVREAFLPDRVTPLDPSRPSIDLLEDLLAGIRACWLIFQEYSDLGVDDPSTDDSSDEEFNGAFDAARRAVRAEFCEVLRVRADADRDRLL